ncbi:MAG: LacI family DNA-binding transcriptional regulator [Methylocella sp.]
MITLKHIAEHLDCSVSTVGRALADHPRIGRETKERVRATAEELGYVVNRAARVMRGGSSHLIGLLVPDIQSTFYSMVAQMLSNCFEREGFHLALSLTSDNRDIEKQQMRELVSARVAGIVTVLSAAPRRETLTLLRMVPHVQLLRQIPAIGDWFGMDEERAICEATTYLLELGHRRIGYVGDLIFSTGKSRYDGFCRAHSDFNLKVDKTLVELGPPNCHFGAESVARLIAKRPRPTAIITTSVQITLGAAEQVMAMKIEVPRSLSMIGYGDGPWQQWWGPGLTTVRLPVEELATGCGLWLLHSMRTGRPTTNKNPHIAITPSVLVKRGSTAPPEAR